MYLSKSKANSHDTKRYSRIEGIKLVKRQFLLLEDHRRQCVLPLLGQFALHAINSSLEEECYKMFVCSLSPDLLEG